MRRVTPKQETLNAFIALLRTNYYKRVAGLQKKREHADAELKRLQSLRKGLVEKNLLGIYSDEIFKEQNKIIEDQIMTLEITKDDALLSKYNLEAIIAFMKDKFADLGKTYQESDIEQIKVLLCSIFDSELTWDYSGISNTKINAVYQCIYDFESVDIANGDPFALCFELTCPKLIIYCYCIECSSNLTELVHACRNLKSFFSQR